MQWFFVLATWLDVVAISACVGALVCAAWVVPRDGNDDLRTSVWSAFGRTIALLILSSTVLLVSRTLEMSNAPVLDLGTYLPLVITKTRYGLIWQYRAGALGLLGLCWWVGKQPRWRLFVEVVAGLSLLLVVFSRSATGHAGDRGMFSAGVWIDSAHVLSSATWVGSLFVMSAVVFPGLLTLPDRTRMLAARTFARLSTTAGIALAAVIATGMYNAWTGLGRIDAFWQSRYGLILSVKLVLVACMICLGACNRYVNLPKLAYWGGLKPVSSPSTANVCTFGQAAIKAAPKSDPGPLRQSARIVNVESFLGVWILILAAVLHHSMPPADARSMITQVPDAPSYVSPAPGIRTPRSRCPGKEPVPASLPRVSQAA